MSKFKVGDKARVVDADLCYKKCIPLEHIDREIHTIEEVFNDPDSVVFEDGISWSWPADALELVESEEFKEEKKYTIQEIFQAIDEWGDMYAPWSKLEIIKYELEKSNDPEYQEYLRLKAKFE